MGNLSSYISQLPNVRCYHDNHEIKGDFCNFEYFHLLIIPNILMWIFKIKTPKENCTHILSNNKKNREAVNVGVLEDLFTIYGK